MCQFRLHNYIKLETLVDMYKSCQYGLFASLMDRLPSHGVKVWYREWLFLCSGVLILWSGDQGCYECAEERLSSFASIVDELKEGKVDRKLLLRYAPVGPQPGTQEGPEPLHGVDMDLAMAVAVLVASVLASAVANSIMFVAPYGKPLIDIVLISINHGPFGNKLFDDRLDSHLLDVFQHMKNDLSPALDQAEDRRFFFLQSASSRRTLKPAAASLAAFF